MRFGSLFSGIGGFDLGFERVGMIPAWQCEIDKHCSALLKQKWPQVPNLGDVRNVRRSSAEAVDLICGGFPCQDLSVAGKRAGLAGERSGLWYEFARVIDELEPRWVVIENVPGLLSSNKGQDFAVIIRWLAERGYGVAWRVLDAQYFGVAQRRRRVFIVGSFGNGRAAEILFESEGVSWNTPSSREAGQEIAREVVGSLDAGGSGGRNAHGGAWPGTTVQSISAGHAFSVSHNLTGRNQRNDFESESFAIKSQHSGIGVTVFDARGNGNGDIVNSLTGDHQNRVTDYTAIAIATLGHTKSNGLGIHETDKANTIEAMNSSNQAMIGGFGVRRLMPIECERLQGFPDGWTEGQSDSARYRQLGNAVAVPCAKWIGKRIYGNN